MIPNFEALDQMIADVEAAKDFKMSNWLNECGTAGCLIGTYGLGEKRRTGCMPSWLSYHQHLEEWVMDDPEAAKQLNITGDEFDWLFMRGPEYQDDRSMIRQRFLYSTTKEQALKRLKLFVEYKKFKHRLITTRETKEDREQYDRARCMSGLGLGC